MTPDEIMLEAKKANEALNFMSSYSKLNERAQLEKESKFEESIRIVRHYIASTRNNAELTKMNMEDN